MVRMTTLQPLTVRAVLAEPVVRRAEPEVLAGESGLDNEVRWVHAGEVPNIASMLRGGELLLSTGMGIGSGAREQRRFAADLAARGVAALAIELGTAMREVPAPLIEAAAAAGLCLIAFHREVHFVEITEVVHRELVEGGGELLRRGEELHKRFTVLMLGGARVPDILVELAGFVGNPVILERSGHGVAYHARHEADDETVLGAWGSYRRGLAAAPDAISERVPMGGGESWGRLVALAVDSPLEAQDQVAVERAVGLIALAMMRESEEDGLAARRRGDFLASLATTRAGSTEIAARAAELGFAPRDGALLPVAMTPASRAEGEVADPAWAALRSDLVEELERRAVPVIAGAGDRGETLLVLGIKSAGDRGRIADALAEIVAGAAARRLGPEQSPAGSLTRRPVGERPAGEATAARGPDSVRPTICVGPACAGWPEVGTALADAARSLPAAATLDPLPWHDLAVASADRLLFTLRDDPELARFADLRLRPLIDRDRQSRGDLLVTLAAYCENSGRKADTAAALGIKRQTLYHRLHRIEDALSADLDDGDTRLSLHLALRANRYLDLASKP
jgi:PucR family transcriptional regulator, purine catabolism regulatory protein